MATTKPVASITAPATGAANSAIAFSGTAQNQISYSWNFGDGVRSWQQNPVHTYAQPGTYTVSFSTTVNGIISTTAKKMIVISGALTVSLSSVSGYATDTAQFTATCVGGAAPISYSWDFGDGAKMDSTSDSIGHSYAAAGTYVVKVSIKDGVGNTAAASSSAMISRKSQTISVSTSPAAIQSGDTVALTPISTSGLPVSIAIDPSSTAAATIDGSTLTASSDGTAVLNYDQSGNAAYSPAPRVQQSLTVSDNPPPPPPPTGSLLYQSNLKYLGAFRVPNNASNGQYFSYGGTALAYNNNSLFIVAGGNQYVGEISIPALVNSNKITDLNTCSILQPLTSVLGKMPSNPSGAGLIGGLMVYGSKLVGTAYVYYDGAGTASLSHFTLSSLNLPSATVGGLYKVGAQGAGLVAGYMAPVPSSWQDKLGYPALTGQANIPIISRTSSGPAAFGFNPNNLGAATAPNAAYLYYPLSNVLGPYEHAAHPIENSNSSTTGIVFAEGTSSVLFFGTTGTSYIGYGINTDWGDSGGGKGPHPLNGEYAFQVWAYDANDLVSVKNGFKQPWQIKPYDTWNFTLPIIGAATQSYSIGGVAYDSSTGRIYVSVMGADTVAAFSRLPVIYAFQLDSAVPPPSISRIGALTGYPQVAASGTNFDTPQYWGTYPGAISRGDRVTLVAGNVYGNVGAVKFYLSALGDTSFANSTLLGTGSISTISFGEHNWQYFMSTSGLSVGKYTVFAQAVASDGTTSLASWVLNVK